MHFILSLRLYSSFINSRPGFVIISWCPSFAIILQREKSWLLYFAFAVCVLRLFLEVQWVGLSFVIVAYPSQACLFYHTSTFFVILVIH